MNISELFIKRPVMAIVLNLLIVFVGILSFKGLLVDEYPKIVVPRITIATAFPNASAEAVESEITFPLEESLAALEGLSSIRSESAAHESNITLQFHSNISMTRAMAQVRDCLTEARRKLPKEASEPVVEPAGSDRHFMYITVESFEFDLPALTHYVNASVKNRLKSVPGVANLMVMGPTYAMSIALNPKLMHGMGVSSYDIVSALKRHEFELPAGLWLGEIPVSIKIAAQEEKEFGNIVVRESDGHVVRLKDVADITRKSHQKSERVRLDQEHAVIIGIGKAGDGNLLEISTNVDKVLAQIEAEAHGKVHVKKLTDNADFVRASMQSMYKAILEACLLVIIVVYLFLRRVRATLVPLVTIPISLIGALAIMKLFGCGINTITLLAIVLAVGLVVDDAIVVLENIHRHREAGLSSLEAAKKGSQEIAFAVVGMTFTLMSVYVPFMFVSDLTGKLLREFAIALAGAIFISGITALTLSPLMCAYFLKNGEEKKGHRKSRFEMYFGRLEDQYEKALKFVLAHRWYVLAVVSLICAVAIYGFIKLPSNLLPVEDRGLVAAYIEPLPGQPLDVQEKYALKVESEMVKIKEASKILTIVAMWGSNVLVYLEPWQKRTRSAAQIKEEIKTLVSDIPSVNIWPRSWDSGLWFLRDEESGQDAEIKVVLKTAGTYEYLLSQADLLRDKLQKEAVLKDVRHELSLDQRNLQVKLDTVSLARLGISPEQVSIALQSFLDDMTPVHFRMEGQRYPVVVSGQKKASDINSIYVTSKDGHQIPLGALAKVKTVMQPSHYKHVQQMRQGTLFASLSPGQSVDDVREYLDTFLKENVPSTIGTEYAGVLKYQAESSKTVLLLFFAGLLFVFAFMAIQFESFLDPLIIVLTVPFACVGAILLLWALGQTSNMFTQLGLITLIGLITKHGILVVDFANRQQKQGMHTIEAIVMASKKRLRPILMTTSAMVISCVPLIVVSGAGAEPRRAIGYVLLGGLCFGTLLTIFVLPVVYILLKKLSTLRVKRIV